MNQSGFHGMSGFGCRFNIPFPSFFLDGNETPAAIFSNKKKRGKNPPKFGTSSSMALVSQRVRCLGGPWIQL